MGVLLSQIVYTGRPLFLSLVFRFKRAGNPRLHFSFVLCDHLLLTRPFKNESLPNNNFLYL
jgi:hypothetical protein